MPIQKTIQDSLEVAAVNGTVLSVRWTSGIVKRKSTMKKNKLNSSNPRYKKIQEVEKTRKVLINNVNGVKIYAVYNI